MPTERAGYTVTLFLVDTSPSMAKLRSIEQPSSDEQVLKSQITNLEWALQFVKLKIQGMIFDGRKTDKCGVIVFGCERTSNIVNKKCGGYDNVVEYIPIAQPNGSTLSKIDSLEPSTGVSGDAIDALIVGIETQSDFLSSKRTWTRKIVLITDGANPLETEDWEVTVEKMNSLNVSLTIVGIDFDDGEFPFVEPDKTSLKRANEEFYHHFISRMKNGIVGTCALALREISRPDIRQVKSTLMGTVLRVGDVDTVPDEAIELLVKTSKCTAISHPKSWKKFAARLRDEPNTPADKDESETSYVQLRSRSEHVVNTMVEEGDNRNGDVKIEDEDEDLLLENEYFEQLNERVKEEHLIKVDKEELVRGFKYGTTYVPCPDGQFPRLSTRKGIDICGFFQAKNFRRELILGEIQYVWADPSSITQQVALSSIVQAMYEKGAMAIARWVTKDGMDSKMGVLKPALFEEVDCLLWAQMPFADDVRKYTFASLENLVSRKGEVVSEHPYIPTEAQLDAMNRFVGRMELSDAGDKDEEGNRQPWFDTLLSYNPAVHRTKQAIFHSAVVSDLVTDPLPSPHSELLKYFVPPMKVLKRSRETIEECESLFKVKKVPKKVKRIRQEDHEHATAEHDDIILLDRKPSINQPCQVSLTLEVSTDLSPRPDKARAETNSAGSETEDDSDRDLFLSNHHHLPTPARSTSP